ncbi:AgmX/PglI C-terminal domain-containing protein [candidate division KSB1 bacterium]|nr:AgmX/PglI C-terminal domain-containing protein [candidate division KSB1 bacterium]
MRAISLKEKDALIETPFSDHYSHVAEFPREFKRKWLKQLDPRFMTILIVTFVFEVGALLLLLSWINNRETNPDIYTIHEKYAKLLLERSDANNADLFEKEKETFLFGVTENIEQATSDGEDQNWVSNPVPLEKKHSGKPGAGASQGASQTNWGSPSGEQGAVSNDLSSRVAKQGLLSYIASDGEKLNNEEIREIFTISERYSRNLEGSLSQIKLANFKQVEGKASEYNEANASERRKGSTINVTTEDLRSSFTPLSHATINAVAKNTELESFSASALAEGGKKTAARKADYVAQVIHSHNRAIQDCYKQALKNEPDLKGKIVVRIMIAPSGGVESVQILQSTIQYEPMLQCIVNRIQRWNDFGESDPSLGSIGYRQTYVFGY